MDGWINRVKELTIRTETEKKKGRQTEGMQRVSMIEMRAKALIREEGEMKEVLAAHFLSQTLSKGWTPR